MVNMWLQASSLLAFLSTTVSGLNIPQARQVAITSSCTYWLDQITHQGVAAFNSNSSYVVYRNVQNYGAKGKPSNKRIIRTMLNEYRRWENG